METTCRDDLTEGGMPPVGSPLGVDTLILGPVGPVGPVEEVSLVARKSKFREEFKRDAVAIRRTFSRWAR